MRLLSLLLGLILSWGVLATIDTYRFSSVEQEQQYRALTEQLRCPKCQNNSIADSNATIAADMRAKVYELMQQGYSKQQIVDYMVARYGNFVTYEPPVTAATIILWAGPLLFVLIGAAIVVLRARRRVEKEPPLSQQEQQRLQSLLAENSVLQNNALQNNKLQEESDRKNHNGFLADSHHFVGGCRGLIGHSGHPKNENKRVTTRDELNKAIYRDRLSELAEDEAQGVIAERPELVKELQQNLLTDIPQQLGEVKNPINRWVLLPGVVVLVVVAVGLYLKPAV